MRTPFLLLLMVVALAGFAALRTCGPGEAPTPDTTHGPARPDTDGTDRPDLGVPALPEVPDGAGGTPEPGGKPEVDGAATEPVLAPLPLRARVRLEDLLTVEAIARSRERVGPDGDVRPPLRRIGAPPRFQDPAPVLSVRFDSSGHFALSAGNDKLLAYREVATGRVLWRGEGHEGYVTDVDIDPQGRYAVSGSWDGTVRLWDLVTGEVLRVLAEPGGTVYITDFDSTGDRVLTAGTQDAAVLYDVESGEELVRYPISSSVYGAAIGPDDRLVAAGNTDGRVIVWKLETGKVVLDLPEAHSQSADEVAFAPNAGLLVTAGSEDRVRVWNLSTGQMLREWSPGGGRIPEIAVSPDGRSLVTCAWDGGIRCFDLASGELRWWQKGHSDYVVTVEYTRDGRTVASAARDGRTRLWDAATGEPKEVPDDPAAGHRGPVNALLFAPDGRRLVSGGEDGVVKVWDLATEEWLRAHADAGSPITHLGPTADGAGFLAGAGDGTVRRYDLVPGRLLETVRGERAPVRAAFFGADGDLRTVHGPQWTAFARSPDGRLGAWGDGEKVEVRELEGDRLVSSLAIARGTPPLAFSPAGTELLAGRGVFRLGGLAPEQEFEDLTATCGAFTRDGSAVLLGLDSGETILRDLADPKRRRSFAGHHGAVRCLAVSFAGTRLATGGADGAIYLFDLTP